MRHSGRLEAFATIPTERPQSSAFGNCLKEHNSSKTGDETNATVGISAGKKRSHGFESKEMAADRGGRLRATKARCTHWHLGLGATEHSFTAGAKMLTCWT
jgi:hypothetical protein